MSWVNQDGQSATRVQVADDLVAQTNKLASQANTAARMLSKVKAASEALDTAVTAPVDPEVPGRSVPGTVPAVGDPGSCTGASGADTRPRQRAKRLAPLVAEVEAIDCDIRMAIAIRELGKTAFFEERMVHPAGRGESHLTVECIGKSNGLFHRPPLLTWHPPRAPDRALPQRAVPRRPLALWAAGGGRAAGATEGGRAALKGGHLLVVAQRM